MAALTKKAKLASDKTCSTQQVNSILASSLSREQFSWHVQFKAHPLIIKNGMNQWGALKKWNEGAGLDYLSTLAPEAVVEVESSSATACFYGDDRFVEPQEMKWPHFLGLLRNNSTKHIEKYSLNSSSSSSSSSSPPSSLQQPTNFYLNQCPISSLLQPAVLASLTSDLYCPSFFHCNLPDGSEWDEKDAPVNAKSTSSAPQSGEANEGKGVQLAEVNLWMTQHLSRTNWHYDTWNNLLGVVRGCKEVLLCSPIHGVSLRPHAVYSSVPNHCQQNLASPGGRCSCKPAPFVACAEHLREIPLWRATLESGDMLFLPEGWWHQVDTMPAESDSLALTIAVNYWWGAAHASSIQEVHALTKVQESQRLYVAREAFSKLVLQEQEMLLADIDFMVSSQLSSSLCLSSSSQSHLLPSNPNTALQVRVNDLAGAVLQNGVESENCFVVPLCPLRTLLSLPTEMLYLVLRRTAELKPSVLCELLRVCSPACCVFLDRALATCGYSTYGKLLHVNVELLRMVEERRAGFARETFETVMSKHFVGS